MGRHKKKGRKPLQMSLKEKDNHRANQILGWQKKYSKCINVRFNIEKDKDILEKLDSEENKADYLRKLIKQDLSATKKS